MIALTDSPVPAGVLLADVHLGHLETLLDRPLAVLVLDRVGELARDDGELVVGSYGRVGVADQLQHAQPADGLAELPRGKGGGELERMMGLGGQVPGGGSADVEGDDVDAALGLPGRRACCDGAGGLGHHGGRSLQVNVRYSIQSCSVNGEKAGLASCNPQTEALIDLDKASTSLVDVNCSCEPV